MGRYPVVNFKTVRMLAKKPELWADMMQKRLI
jgi:hypothetical protein